MCPTKKQRESDVTNPPDDPKRPLRILQCASCFGSWGGAELHLLNLSEQLVKRGHEVHITAVPGKFVEQDAARRGIPTIPIHQRRTHDWPLLPKLQDAMREHRFDVVHVHGGREYVMPPLAAKLSHVPAVLMTRHFHKRVRSLRRWMYSKVLMDHVIAVADMVRGVLIESGFPPEQVTTIHHCTNVDEFSPDAVTIPAKTVRQEWGIPPGDTRLVVGFAGRFVPDKGGDVFVKALARVPDAVGVLLGTGDCKDEWTRLAHEAGLGPDRMFWGGFRADIQNGLNAFDVFVLPSIYAEPCAAVVQQAMAMGKPVIGTRLGGTPEMIAEHETGLLVPAQDDAALADAIRDLAGRPAAERNAMGERGRQRVVEHFSLTRMAERTETLYRQIIASKKGAAA